MKHYIGIDPGKNGGVAVITVDGDDRAVNVFAYDDDIFRAALQQICFEECVCCIEEVHAMPKQGVTSSFNFGKSYGYLLGVLDACFIPYQPVRPQVWKKEFGLNSDKLKSIEVCKRLFPGINLRRTEKCKTDHDGMAEALLMAEYARRKL